MKLISIAITIIKKTRNMIYLTKIKNWFSCAKKLVIKKAAAGIIKFRNLSCQKLEIFEHLHSHNNDLQRTSQEYCISDTKTVMPHNFNLNNSRQFADLSSPALSLHTHTLHDNQSSPIQSVPLHFT